MNDGMGVLERDKENIFKPYERGSNYDHIRYIVGTGMGLYTAREILRAHDGDITVWCELFDMRDYVIPDDIKALAQPTLAHRVIISPAARIKNVDARAVVEEILRSTPVPGTRVRVGKS